MKLFDSLDRDITAHKHGGDHQSQLAHESIKPAKHTLWRLIYQFITECGGRGATLHEVANGLDLPIQTVSARMSEMKCAGAEFPIWPNGMKRAARGSRTPARAFVTSEGQLKGV